jgi:hypothetical protein
MNLFDKAPKISGNVFIAPNAAVIGDVEVGPNTSIWYGAVIRGTPFMSPLFLCIFYCRDPGVVGKIFRNTWVPH